MISQLDRFCFDSPKGVLARSGYGAQISRFMGYSPGIELHDRMQFREWDFSRNADALAFLDALAAPAEATAGTEWANTQLTASTITLQDGGFPSFIRWATGAGDGNGQSAQNVIGTGAATRLPFDFSVMRNFIISGTFRISDANNNAATVEQCRFFFGIAPADTSIFTAVANFAGFAKDDGSGILKVVADQASVAPHTSASSSLNLANLSSAGANARSLINKWFTLTLVGVGLVRTGTQKGVIYAFLDQASQPAGSSDFTPTHVGTLDLGTLQDVPAANGALTLAFTAGEAVAKNLDFAKIMYGIDYVLG